MIEENNNYLPSRIICAVNHAGYVREEDEYSTNPDDLYITNKEPYVSDTDNERVDKNEVISFFVKRLKLVEARLKNAKNPKEKRKLEKIIGNIKSGLFLEREFIERSRKQKFAEFMAGLSK